jgi:hypothetical protein
VTGVRIEMCIDIDPSDFTVLLMIARQDNMPLDALVKKIIADYVARRLAPSPPAEQFKSPEEKEKKGEK